MNRIRPYLDLWNKRRVSELDIYLLEEYILSIVKKRTSILAPDEALRFLFRLDANLYSIQGQEACRYGKGIHPKHRLMKYHDFFVNRIKNKERVLDIGCGIGAVAWDVAEKSGAEVMGIDINEANIKIAKESYQHPKVTYFLGDALKDLPDQKFDVVILSNVLEHLSQRPQFLIQVQTIIQPKRILIRVPLFERDWRVPLKQELSVEWRLDLTHETEYTQESFTQEIKESGMTILYEETRWGEIWAEVASNVPKS